MPDLTHLGIPTLQAAETLANQPEKRPVVHTQEIHRNPLFALTQDTVDFGDGQIAARDYLHHVGAVAVVALTDDHQCVLINQYRHPARERLWELPAGLRDVAGEPPQLTAQRELAEETGLQAQHWSHLIDLHLSPGCSSELISIYAAWGLSQLPAESRTELHHEESTLRCALVPIKHILASIDAGETTNASLVAGILTASRLLQQGTLHTTHNAEAEV